LFLAAPVPNGHSSSDLDDPSNFLLSAKTKLQHLAEEEREHLNRFQLLIIINEILLQKVFMTRSRNCLAKM
jgi:hypothetical protein